MTCIQENRVYLCIHLFLWFQPNSLKNVDCSFTSWTSNEAHSAKSCGINVKIHLSLMNDTNMFSRHLNKRPKPINLNFEHLKTMGGSYNHSKVILDIQFIRNLTIVWACWAVVIVLMLLIVYTAVIILVLFPY